MVWSGLVGAGFGLHWGQGIEARGETAPVTPFFSQNFIKAKKYPPSTQVEVQNDGAESAVFQQLFQKWTVPNRTSGLGKTHTVGSIGEGRAGRVGWELGVGRESTQNCLLPSSPATPLPCTLLPRSVLSRWGRDTNGHG